MWDIRQLILVFKELRILENIRTIDCFELYVYKVLKKESQT